MSECQHVAPSWPRVANLAEAFAEMVARDATRRAATTGASAEATLCTERRVALAYVEALATALYDATEMALDVWEVTEEATR